MNSRELTLDKIRKEGYEPTKTAYTIIKTLGADLATHAFSEGTLSLKCNDDKTFDVVIAQQIIDDCVDKLRVTLKNRGYSLTVKGERYIDESYKNGRFTHHAISDALNDEKRLNDV